MRVDEHTLFELLPPPAMPWLRQVHLSADERHVAWSDSYADGDEALWLDGARRNFRGRVERLVLGRDSRRVAFVHFRYSGSVVHVDDRAFERVAHVERLGFSPVIREVRAVEVANSLPGSPVRRLDPTQRCARCAGKRWRSADPPEPTQILVR